MSQNSHNRLREEKSPYLLQHADNPVHWQPYSEETFALAKEQDKPVFISIGYATCHWCHVMERESFEDEQIAQQLNDTFICIKVDREERPDVDAVYMTACQMMSGRGGWPLTVFADPQGRPFFAATYLPPRNRAHQTGLLEMAQRVAEIWKDNRETATGPAEQLATHITQYYERTAKGGDGIGHEALDTAYRELARSYDLRFGGFGQAPKFPTPHNLSFLIRHALHTNEPQARDIAVHTLERMRCGGIWDHIGFGFHRYSTDERWLVPHFEKMLYDQAAMTLAYLDGYRISGTPLFARTVHEILEYVERDLTLSNGAYASAEDADSEGQEGRFYLWKTKETLELLSANEGAPFNRLFNLEVNGNYRDEMTQELTGSNIPHLSSPLSEKDRKIFNEIRPTLLEARAQRQRPQRDDKALTDWNAMIAAALARAARELDVLDYVHRAERITAFLMGTMRNADGTLMHRWCDGQTAVPGMADDYAYTIRALLEVYRTTFNTERLAQAIELQQTMDRILADTQGGGYFLAPADAPGLPVRPKEIYDGPTPSANSMALHNLLDLYRITGDTQFSDKADALMKAFSGTIASQPSAYSHFLAGVAKSQHPGCEVVIAGDRGDLHTHTLIAVTNRVAHPDTPVLLRDPQDEALPRMAPFCKDLLPIDDTPTAYVCEGRSCSQPTTSPNDLAELLKK